jgi:hypothetical protein
MKAEELRAIQAPHKERYREAPETARITLHAKGRIGESLSCKVETGKALVTAGIHPGTGGTGQSACSGDMLLQVTVNAVASALSIELRNAVIEAEGDLDFRGTLGLSREVPVGFQNIRLQFTLDTDASEEQLVNPSAPDRTVLRGLPDVRASTSIGFFAKARLSDASVKPRSEETSLYRRFYALRQT